MDDLKRFDRILKIFFLLQSNYVLTNEELQRRFGIGRRTIYRDLKALESAGIPIVNEAGEGYSIMEGFRIPPLRFTQEETLGLMVAEKVMQQQETAFIKQHFESALIKIKSSFLLQQKYHLLQMEGRVSFNRDIKSGNYLPNVIDVLVNSLLTKHVALISYQKRTDTEPIPREIEPVGLYFENYFWYLLAYCHLRGEYRNFRIDRVSSVQLLEKQFTQEHLPLKELRTKISATQITPIVISVEKEHAHYMFWERMEYGFKKEKETNGRLIMYFDCPTHPVSFARWLMRFVDIATIIEPVSLQQELVQILTDGLRNNEKDHR